MNLYWLKIGAVAALAVGGVAGGMYLADRNGGAGESGGCPNCVPKKVDNVQRFPLTALDIRDQIEAPKLATDDGGHVLLAWASQVGDGERAMFLSMADENGRFAEPKAVARTGIVKFVSEMKGKTITRDSRMLPQIAIADGVLHAAWVEAMPDLKGVRMVHATSDDAGETFSAPQQVHQSDAARPTFTAVAIGPKGEVACSWLDNREKVQRPFAAVREATATAFSPELRVAAGDSEKGTCPCCPTAAAFASDGTLYVAFRNVADGYRDFYIGRKSPGKDEFEGPFPIVPPTWKFDGCPHDGATLAVVGDELHVAWMDARDGSPRCYYAKAKRADMKFVASPLHGIEVGSQGNAKLAIDPEGTLHAVWEESSAAGPPPGEHRHGPPQAGTSRTIMYAQKHSCCPRFMKAYPIAPREGAFQTRPAIVITSLGERVVAWNELDEQGKTVAVVRLGEKFGHD